MPINLKPRVDFGDKHEEKVGAEIVGMVEVVVGE